MSMVLRKMTLGKIVQLASAREGVASGLRNVFRAPRADAFTSKVIREIRRRSAR
jgi:hypothetical protein